MTDTEHGEGEWPTVEPIPAWIAPLLKAEDDKRYEARRRHEDEMRGVADAINQHLAYLGIVPLTPAEWTPDGLRNAVLLRPDHCDVDEWGVQAGWNGQVALYAVTSDGIERYFGPLGSVQDAAEARRGPRAVRPEPPEHDLLAEDELGRAVLSDADVDDYSAGEIALLAVLRGLVRSVLALNDTVSRFGARQALRQAAALGDIPLDRVRLVPEEKRLLADLFPPSAADLAEADSAGDG